MRPLVYHDVNYILTMFILSGITSLFYSRCRFICAKQDVMFLSKNSVTASLYRQLQKKYLNYRLVSLPSFSNHFKLHNFLTPLRLCVASGFPFIKKEVVPAPIYFSFPKLRNYISLK
jgi:hypothetical protein